MRLLFGAAFSILLTITPALMPTLQGTQADSTATTPPKAATKPALQTVTLMGCVEGTGTTGNPFTLLNTKDGVAYKLTGTNMRAFAGKRVQIVGGPDSRRLRVVGGLTPSPNAAAQAGSLDPSRAVVESDPLVTTGKSDQALPEFRVRSVRSVAGACEK